MFRVLILILISVFCFQSQAAIIPQDTLMLSATVVDEVQEPLPYATVLLITEEGEILKSTTTDSKGVFNISKEGTDGKFIAVRFMGYKQARVSIPLPTVIQLEPNSNTLQEVIVKEKRAVYKVSEGTFEIDVSKSELKKLPEVADVLAFLPGMLATGGRVVPISGGTPLYILNGVEQKSYDRIGTLRPEQIKTVNVNYYPPAKYSAQYGCIISITTNQQLTDYFSAQVEHNSLFGRRYTEEDVLRISLSKKKWDNLLSYNFSYLNEDNTGTNQYDVLSPKGKTERSSISYNNEILSKPAHHIVESFSYRPNQKFNITFQGDINISNKKANTQGDEYNHEYGLNTLYSNTHQDERSRNISVNADLLVNYTMTDKQQLSVSGGYFYAKAKSEIDLVSNSKNRSRINGKNDYNAFNTKIEYDYNSKKGFSLNVGFQGNSILNKGYSNYIFENTTTPFYNITSNLQDDELSLFATINQKWNKLFITAGVRGSIFHSEYEQNKTNSITDTYFKLFPRITAQWQINPDLLFIGSIITQNSRPMFRDISPLLHYINPYLYEKGNSSLKSNDRYIYSLSMVWKNKFVLQGRYIHDANAVLWKFTENSELNGALLNSPVNVDYNTWLFNASYSDKFGIYRFAYNASFRYIPTKIKFLDTYAHRNPNIAFTLVNQFDITKQMIASIDLSYSSKNGFLGVLESPKYGLSFWIRQNFFKDNRLQIILRGNDLLHKSISKTNVFIDNIKVQTTPDFDSRFLLLTIKYTFNGFKDTFRRLNTNESNQKRLNLQ